MEVKDSSLRNKIDNVVKYLDKHLDFANCHMVEFISLDYWNKYIPSEIINEVDENGIDAAIEFFWEFRKHISTNNLNPTDKINKLSKFDSLSKFITEAHAHCLFEDEYCISVNNFHKKIGREKSRESVKINQFMSHKKSHEVEKLSHTIAMLYDWSNATHVIDLGGGKGYLSAMLTMYYNISVLNIDCNEINHKGAIERNNKIEKLWPGIVKNAQKCKNTLNTNMDNLTISNSLNDLSNKEKMTLYKHAVQFVTEDTDLVKLINDNFELNLNPKICITGLHTCGSLGTNSLKLFTRCHSSAVLCTVPCCYNLMSENDSDSPLQDNIDFPMSNYLKGRTIGRNARMLAAQSVERVIELRQLPNLSIFYRSLLQVLISDNYNSNDGKMGKSGENSNNFADYVKIAKEKLKLDTEKINDDTLFLNTFELNHSEHKNKLNLFYLLRMCLAPVIENLILLDRLMFLIENGYDGHLGEAYLMKMFDPIVSPRHTSLIAYRYNI